MTTGYQIKEQDKLHFVTLQVVEWVDIFSKEKYRKIIIKNLKYCVENKGLEIYAWVIMSNHIHLLVKSTTENLSGTIRDFKSYTSKLILDEITEINESRKDWMLKLFEAAAFKHKRNTNYQFWTHENHSEHIFSNKYKFGNAVTAFESEQQAASYVNKKIILSADKAEIFGDQCSKPFYEITQNYTKDLFYNKFNEEALEKDGCGEIVFTGKSMKECVFVSHEGMKTKKEFNYWINLCLEFNSKAKSAKKKKK